MIAMMFDPSLLPPLPVTLEKSHEEIRYLQRQLFLSRQNLAKQIEEREKDRRAARGNIRALSEELKVVREALKNAVQNKENT